MYKRKKYLLKSKSKSRVDVTVEKKVKKV